MFNYENIGEKIKIVAKVFFIILAILGVFSGIICVLDGEYLGMLIIIVGPIFAWVSSLSLYGFGQLIENSDIIANEYRHKKKKHENDNAKSTAHKPEQTKKQIKAGVTQTNIDGNDYIDITCSNCNAELSFTKDQFQDNQELICPMCNATIHI